MNKPSLCQLLGLCTSKGRTAVPPVLELTARERPGAERESGETPVYTSETWKFVICPKVPPSAKHQVVE